MRLLENLSPDALRRIQDEIIKTAETDEFLKEFGDLPARSGNAEMYLRSRIRQWYDEGDLYEDEAGTSYLAVTYAEGKNLEDYEDWKIPRIIRRSIPRRIRRAFCAQLAEDERNRIQFWEKPHMRVELFAPAGADTTTDTAADMVRFVCYEARVRRCPVLFDTCDPATAGFLVSQGAAEYNRARTSNGIGRFYLVWRPSHIEIPEVAARNVYLVDTAQIGSLWVRLLDEPLGNDRIVLFYNDEAGGIPLAGVRTILEKGSQHISWIRCSGSEPMSSQITTQLGYMISEAPQNHYFVLSSDADFNVVRQYWAGRNAKILQLTPSQLSLPAAERYRQAEIAQNTPADHAESTRPEAADGSEIDAEAESGRENAAESAGEEAASSAREKE